MPTPAYLAHFIAALSLGFVLFGSVEVQSRPKPGKRPKPTKKVPAQVSCPIVRNYFPRIGYPGYGLTIEGENLGGVTDAMFANDISGKFEPLSDNKIAITIPIGAASGPIKIRKMGCQDAATDLFTIPPPPQISLGPESQNIEPGATAPINVNFSTGIIVPTIVTIQSSNPDVASAPSFLVVPPGAISAAFNVTGIAAGEPATISATLPENLGGMAAAATVSVTSPLVRVVRVAEC